MDWERITQNALVCADASASNSIRQDISIDQGLKYHNNNTTDETADYRIGNRRRGHHNDHENDVLEDYVQDLRNATVLQSKKVLSIEKILSSYSDVFESSSEAQITLVERVDGLEQNIRGSNRVMNDASRERSSAAIQMKSLYSKVISLEESFRDSELCYATKEAFSQLLGSTVDEIKSVSVAVSNASVKSSQSISLIEALIQAIHRMRGHSDTFSEDSDAAGRTLSYDFLSSLTG
jgi:hypothetical protein